MTATALARKFRLRAETSAGVFALMAGVTALDFPPVTPNMADSTSYENEGWTTSEPTAYGWSATATALRRITGGTAYDPCQEFLRLKSLGQFGDQARAHIQILDKNGGPEAYDGYAYVQYGRANSGVQDLDAATFTFTGDGALTTLAQNPFAGSLVPQLVSATPGGKGAGDPVSVYGNFLAGTISVTVNAIAAPKFFIVNDNQIIVVLPVGAAATGPIVVTNASGASAGLPYTRIA